MTLPTPKPTLIIATKSRCPERSYFSQNGGGKSEKAMKKQQKRGRNSQRRTGLPPASTKAVLDHPDTVILANETPCRPLESTAHSSSATHSRSYAHAALNKTDEASVLRDSRDRRGHKQ